MNPNTESTVSPLALQNATFLANKPPVRQTRLHSRSGCYRNRDFFFYTPSETPVIPPKTSRKLLMVLSSALYLPVNRDNMGDTTELCPPYFRVITNTPQFDYRQEFFQKPRVVTAGLNAYRRRRQQLPLTTGRRKSKTVYKNKYEWKISLVDANSTINACCP